MSAYYNDNDPFKRDWLRNLIYADIIAHGEVDGRDIKDVRPSDVRGRTQCHFFAGIGGWPIALRMAGWPDDKRAWTGSCPCGPFSEAGLRKGFSDARHLWPVWFPLIRECRPPIIFGEQVPEAVSLGWLDEVSLDLESANYAIGAAVLSGCVVEARQERERLWFVACANGEPMERFAESRMERNPWPAEPDVARVAYGVREHRSIVRSFGDAIIPRLAAEFVSTMMST